VPHRHEECNTEPDRATCIVGPYADTQCHWIFSLSAFLLPSANGDTPAADQLGATFVFLRTSGSNSWTEQAKLSGVGAVGSLLQGASLALSASGTILAVGEREGVRMWKRTGITWTEIGSRLVGSDPQANENQGTSVSISASGLQLAIGSHGSV
jgi:hypothetical protein